MDIQKVLKAFEHNGFKASFFSTKQEAADYLCSEIQGCTVGFGGSQTVEELDLINRLSEHNTCISPELPYRDPSKTFQEAAKDTLLTDVFILSANGASEDGQLVNIDGTGNRVGSSMFGHKKVYFVFGTNKIMPDLASAIERARNVASPRNARFLECKTPCAVNGGSCQDCSSPERICSVMAIYMKSTDSAQMEVVIIGEELGY